MTGSRRLPRSRPESQGIASAAILALVERLEERAHDVHSFMLLRNGSVVAEGWWEPYGRDLPHVLFSLTKSFTSTAVGMAIADGCFSLDDPVVSFFPDDLPNPVPENLAAMRVRHLLTMTTGHAEDSNLPVQQAPDGNGPRAFLAHPVEHLPGTHFLYDTGASHILSTIVQQRTGEKLADYLRPRLFDPLAIGEVEWEEDPHGVNTGGYGLSLRTEEIAAFGQLYLQRGVWNGRRLIDEEWIAAATSRQTENGTDPQSDWAQGYGYQFWRCRHGGYRGDGAFGQYCVVMPERNLVLAMTSGLADMQIPLDAVWETLLAGVADGPMPEDADAQARLAAKLAGLALAPPAGRASAPAAARVTGRSYRLADNELWMESLRFDFSEAGCTLTTTDPRGVHTLDIGYGEWLRSESTMFERPVATAAGGAWIDESRYVATARAYLTPFDYTFDVRFEDDRVEVVTRPNVAFEPIHPVRLTGTAT